MICSLRSSLCPGEEVDDWVGHWAIHHQTLGTPGLAQLQVQKVNDQVDAVLSSNTGVAKMASVVADGDTLQLAYNVDIRGLTRVVE